MTREQDEVAIKIRTTLDIGHPRFAQGFLAVLERQGPDWLPTRFGPYEPLKHSYETEEPSGFEQCWLTDPEGDPDVGDVIFKTSRRIRAWGWVRWRRRWNQTFNGLSLFLPADQVLRLRVENVLGTAQEIFETFGAAYGTIALDSEFRTQHRLPETGPNPHGIALEQHIPGVYYANLFGRELVEFLGRDALKECPAIINHPLPDGGWLVTTAHSPAE